MMAEIFTGRISFDKGKWKIVFFDERKQKDSTLFCLKNVFARDFAPKEDEETEVHFERDATPQRNAIRVREKDAVWNDVANHPQVAPRNADRWRHKLPGDFHNPYNFVPALPRKNLASDLGDREPSGHDRYVPEKYSGKLRVRMIVETPLLLPDAASVEIAAKDEKDIKKGHKVFDVRTDENGKPVISPTAVKGMLRSAYEAVTNSRLSVFQKHDERLAFRSEAKIGAVPARVTKREDGQLYFRVMNSAKLRRYQIGDNLGKDKGEQYAAKTYNGEKYSNESLPQTGDAVWVQLNTNGAVEQLARRRLGETRTGWQAGWVYVTGANIDGKKNERVFLESPHVQPIKIEEKHRGLWSELISNYQEIHQKDLADREKKEPPKKPSDYLGKEPGKTAWSRHIYNPDAKELVEGTLCYLNFKRNSDTEIDAVIPVTISRRLFETPPSELLPEELHPGTDIEKLSPSDRVFGWVRQGNRQGQHSAYRGQLRIGHIEYSTENEADHIAIERLDDEPAKVGLPLQILGQPKPQQGRFYVAETSENGEAQIEKRSNEDSGFKKGRGLRGRKVYPHHRLPEGYWHKPTQQWEKPLLGKYFQEFRRPNGNDQRDKQNRSVKSWVKPQTVFDFEIHFINLSGVELGALLWLLQLEPDHFHRFGGGKPLGFGSVHLKVTGSEICNGENLKNRYRSLDEVELQLEDPQNCVDKFIAAIEKDYGRPFDQVPFIKAFLKGARGFDKPIHYPRTTEAPKAEGESFEWFVVNNRIERGSVKHGLVLPDLSEDEGLPILKKK